MEKDDLETLSHSELRDFRLQKFLMAFKIFPYRNERLFQDICSKERINLNFVKKKGSSIIESSCLLPLH